MSASVSFFRSEAFAPRTASSLSAMDVVSECRPAVSALVARVLRRPQSDPDVEDCTHEALRRALESQASLDDGRPILPWVLGIARHVALDALRVHYRQQARLQTNSNGFEHFLDHQSDPQCGPDTQAANRQELLRLEHALQQLPEGQRKALVLLHVEGLGYREIASRLGVAIGTVGTWVLRGRQNLIQALGNKETGRPARNDAAKGGGR